MSNITDFITYELYPALWDRLDRAFPYMDFQKRGGDWQSPKKLNGEASTPQRGGLPEYWNREAIVYLL